MKKPAKKKAAPAEGEPHPELFAHALAERQKAVQPEAEKVPAGAPLPFKLDKPLVFLDLEATGLDVKEDRIVEFAALKVQPDGTRETLYTLVDPGIPIPAEVAAIHGLTDDRVQGQPRFLEVAERIFAFLSGCDIGGFGVARFDLHMLAQEFKRAGLDFTDTSRRVLDAQQIFHKREPRDLAAALMFYCGRNLADAHSARADTEASFEVFVAQFYRYSDLPRDLGAVHAWLTQSDGRFVDSQGRLFWRHGQACFNFGKHRSKSLEEIARTDPGYLDWLIGEGKSSDELLKIYRDARRGFFPKKPAA